MYFLVGTLASPRHIRIDRHAVDETITIRMPPPPKLSFRSKSPQKHSLCIVPEKSRGDDRIRLCQIPDGAGIPLDLNGLLYKDLYGSEFREYRSLQLDFYSEQRK
jgi:hypothetical protein